MTTWKQNQKDKEKTQMTTQKCDLFKQKVVSISRGSLSVFLSFHMVQHSLKQIVA